MHNPSTQQVEQTLELVDKLLFHLHTLLDNAPVGNDTYQQASNLAAALLSAAEAAKLLAPAP